MRKLFSYEVSLRNPWEPVAQDQVLHQERGSHFASHVIRNELQPIERPEGHELFQAGEKKKQIR